MLRGCYGRKEGTCRCLEGSTRRAWWPGLPCWWTLWHLPVISGWTWSPWWGRRHFPRRRWPCSGNWGHIGADSAGGLSPQGGWLGRQVPWCGWCHSWVLKKEAINFPKKIRRWGWRWLSEKSLVSLLFLKVKIWFEDMRVWISKARGGGGGGGGANLS